VNLCIPNNDVLVYFDTGFHLYHVWRVETLYDKFNIISQYVRILHAALAEIEPKAKRTACFRHTAECKYQAAVL